jgi:hypothetical protein
MWWAPSRLHGMDDREVSAEVGVHANLYASPTETEATSQSPGRNVWPVWWEPRIAGSPAGSIGEMILLNLFAN